MIEGTLIVDARNGKKPVAQAGEVDGAPERDRERASPGIADGSPRPIEDALQGGVVGNIEHRTGQAEGPGKGGPRV